MTFRESAEQTPGLQNAWRAGLGALRPQDRPHVSAQSTRKLEGSIDIDAAYRPAQPNANRWDFAIGYRHTNRADPFVYFAEMHTGSDGEIGVVLRKLEWLKGWLRSGNNRLAGLERDIVWVASGSTSFTKGATQVKTLAAKGLRYSGKILHIPDEHPNASPR